MVIKNPVLLEIKQQREFNDQLLNKLQTKNIITEKEKEDLEKIIKE